MSPIPQELPANILRQTNHRLTAWLECLFPNGDPVPATPQQMMGLLSDLRCAGEWMRAGLPEERDSQLEAELGEYRRNLDRLRDCMPAIHRQLLAERSRLEAERARIESAAQWAESSRQTR